MNGLWELETDQMGYPASPPKTYRATSMVGRQRSRGYRVDQSGDVTQSEVRELLRRLREVAA